ncbi:MAG TPA: ABC transporter ATP-binding protein, partial [Anaerolineae bacterium]
MSSAAVSAEPKKPIAQIVPPSDDTVIGKAYDPHITRRLFRYLRPYYRPIYGALALMIVGTIASVAGPYLIKVALDNGVASQDRNTLLVAVLLYLGAGAIIWVTTFFRIRIMAVVGQSIIYDLRAELFAHLQNLSLGFYSRYSVGRLISRVVNDVSVLREMITWAIIDVARALFDLLGITLAMFLLNWQLSILSFLVLPLMFVATEAFRRRARQSYRKVRSAIGWVNAVLNENIVGVRVVQSFSREERNFRFFADEVNGNNLRVNMQAALITSIFFPTVDFIGTIALGLVVWVGGLMVLGQFGLGGNLTAGTLVAFALYIDRFFDPIRALSNRYNTFQATMAGSERIFELLDTPVEIRNAPSAIDLPTIKGQVEFRNVSFHYSDDPSPVLQDIDLLVRAGQTCALVGETGAGKSTLVKLVSRFYDVTGGTVLIDGVDICTIKQESLRRQMGIVLQDPFLFAGTVADNIRYGLHPDRDKPSSKDDVDLRVKAAARAVGAHEFIMALDKGYDTLVGEGGAILSGGQRQLISFARALLADPRILVLDEATSSVDTQTEKIIQAALETLFH